jgi:hypothetical protein
MWAPYWTHIRLVPPDLLALLGELPRHCLHMGGQLRFLILQRLHLGLIRLSGQFPENVCRSPVLMYSVN